MLHAVAHHGALPDQLHRAHPQRHAARARGAHVLRARRDLAHVREQRADVAARGARGAGRRAIGRGQLLAGDHSADVGHAGPVVETGHVAERDNKEERKRDDGEQLAAPVADERDDGEERQRERRGDERAKRGVDDEAHGEQHDR